MTIEREGDPPRLNGKCPPVTHARTIEPAMTWLLIAIFAATPLVVVGVLLIADPKNLTYSQLINYIQSPERILLPIIGILTVTSEWSQRTGLITLTLEPDRPRVPLAKLTATLVILVGLGSAAIGNLLGIALRDDGVN